MKFNFPIEKKVKVYVSGVELTDTEIVEEENVFEGIYTQYKLDIGPSVFQLKVQDGSSGEILVDKKMYQAAIDSVYKNEMEDEEDFEFMTAPYFYNKDDGRYELDNIKGNSGKENIQYKWR